MVGARMLAVVDVYDALTTERPYKTAFSPEATRQYLLAQAGRRFDPGVVTGFLHALDPAADRAITRELPTISGSLALKTVSAVRPAPDTRRPSSPLSLS